MNDLDLQLQSSSGASLANAGSTDEVETIRFCVSAGEQVVAEGTPGDALYLVLSGTVTVVKQKRFLATLAAGEFFGEMSLVEPAPRSASVIAADSAFLFRLPYFEFQNMLESDPRAFTSVFVAIVRVLSERLRRSNELLGSIGELADWLAGSLV